MSRPRRVRLDGIVVPDRYQRHEAPWPPEKLETTPCVYDPRRRILISSFPRHSRCLALAERQCLERVQERIAQLEALGELPDVPFWIWPGSGAIVPLREVSPGWLQHWARDRAAYQVRMGRAAPSRKKVTPDRKTLPASL